MHTQEIVAKLWNLCNVLRDDGITYHQYVTELTFILYLKMAKETGAEYEIPEAYRWDKLVAKEGTELRNFYRELLLKLGTEGQGKTKQIYANAQTNIAHAANLYKIIQYIDRLDWYSAKVEGLGDLYEGLLEKNASETLSGAGQYFTPRPLIDVLVRMTDPKPGEKCNDPACGTFGFMIAIDHYLREKYDDYYAPGVNADFQRKEALSGCELVADTHRLALMNAALHGLDSQIWQGDSLSQLGEGMKGYDVVLANPPFGTKKGGERPTRTDFTFPTANKQLNFLQHIYRSLKADGRARAAAVLPDNVLFQDGDGQKIRADLMNKCNLHTILRLPTGIFYAQGVKTNVLFFTRGTGDKSNTKEVWYYDMRIDMPSFGKRTPLTREHFAGFTAAYGAKDRKEVQDNRWQVISREEIRKRGDNLDLGLIADPSLGNHEDMPEPQELASEALLELTLLMDDLKDIVTLLDK